MEISNLRNRNYNYNKIGIKKIQGEEKYFYFLSHNNSNKQQ